MEELLQAVMCRFTVAAVAHNQVARPLCLFSLTGRIALLFPTDIDARFLLRSNFSEAGTVLLLSSQFHK